MIESECRLQYIYCHNYVFPITDSMNGAATVLVFRWDAPYDGDMTAQVSRARPVMSTESPKTPGGIGTLNEKPLHEALKRFCAEPGDAFEVPLDGFVVDILREGLVVEIQTRNFKAMQRKLGKLLADREVRLVYPIAQDKWITKEPHPEGGPGSRRKSPKHGRFESVFDELVSFPTLLADPNFSVELLLIEEEEVRRYDGSRGWRRRGWVTHERRLLEVVDRRVLRSPADLVAFLPSGLTESFTTGDMVSSMRMAKRLAQRMAYCLRVAGCIAPVGKRSNAILYSRSGA